MHTIDWVRQTGTGMVLSSFGEIARALEQMLQPEMYAHYRERVLRIRNRAVFEIPAILDRIMSEPVRPELRRPLAM
jgi:1,2-diacylglycerol 3-beta-galactosyltransferase